MPRALSALLALFTALSLTACARAEDKTPDYRFRLTVEVETPEGLKTGSSVIEVEQTATRSGFAPGAGVGVRKRARGEAVAVDLPGGQTLFALLRSPRDIDWAARIVAQVAPRIPHKPGEERFDNVLLVEGVVELPPQGWPEKLPVPAFDGYPMLVTFGDVADPASVARVDPADLAASFGEGVRLKRITVELTEDPVTRGIEERFGWLGMSFKGFESEDFPDDIPVGDFNGLFTKR